MLDKNMQVFEWDLLDAGIYGEYRSMVDEAVSQNRENYFSNIRYMLSLSHRFYQAGGLDEYMFVGGAGVLGNFLKHAGYNKIFDCRDIHDLDMVLFSKRYGFLVEDYFDVIDVAGKSLSIKDKITIRGYSVDCEERDLDKTNIDLYVPSGKPQNGIYVDKIFIGPEQWKKRVIVDVMGIPVSVADPFTLLLMKLNIISGRRSNRRKKDCKDIECLVGVLDREGYSTERYLGELSQEQHSKLISVFGNNCDACSDCELKICHSLIRPSEVYIRDLINSGVKDEDLNSF